MLKERKFKKTKEDFICEHCGQKIIGNGFTDHCPNCLWSKHVDINPGDRKAECSGLMKPKQIEIKSGKYIIHYQCEKCGFKHRVKAVQKDNWEELIALSH